MEHTRAMIDTHPRGAAMDAAALAACIDACYACAQSCTACADACLAEEGVAHLRRCIRLNLDCADVCAATGSVLSRQTEPPLELLRAQLEACRLACRLCGEECGRHAEMHEHCRVCAEACRRCEEACARLLRA